MRHPEALSPGTESAATSLVVSFASAASQLATPSSPFGLPSSPSSPAFFRRSVVENDRVDIQGHAILLAVGPLSRLPVGGAEIARLDAGGRELLRRDRAQRPGRDSERHARFMIGHDVRALTDRG